MSSEALSSHSPAPAAGAPYLSVQDLQVHFTTDDGVVKSVDGLSFQLDRGQTLGIVGESGSGKSVTSMAVMGLHTASNARISGSIQLDGQELVGADREVIRKLRGKKMAMIFQDPLSSMHPFYTVGNQIIEAYRIHNNVSKKAARAHAIDMLDRVGIPEPSQRVDAYPHQFSGGMRQRAMIAMSLSCDPDLLIADEPTTALDVTVQAQILDLVMQMQAEFGMAILFISHNLAVVSEVADDVAVMYAGRIVELAPAAEIFANPLHPYTRGLIETVPRIGHGRKKLPAIRGTVPDPLALPPGCRFSNRCPLADDTCRRADPPWLCPCRPHRRSCPRPSRSSASRFLRMMI